MELAVNSILVANDGDYSARESLHVNVDPDEVVGSPSSPYDDEEDDSEDLHALMSPFADLTSHGSVVTAHHRRHHHHHHHHHQDRSRDGRNSSNQMDLSLLALVLEALRRSGMTCRGSPANRDMKMDIGWPTDVRHVAHVTFDRFNGFLGLPAEFQREVPHRVPSASVSVFGVSPESMQCSYDRNGNSVPTILLLMQKRLYDLGGLKAEGVFRINAENGREEQLREEINSGIVPYDIDVHCLAGLIKAWFRELPRGVLDSLSPEKVMQCNSEGEAVALVKTLPPMQGALLDWGINLMADVVQEERFNKMNAHNIAMVFAPNMTQMSDPLTALMHAVQVMNLLKTLILRVLKDREELRLHTSGISPCSGNGRDNSSSKETLTAFSQELGHDDTSIIDQESLFLKSSSFGTSENTEDDFESARESSEETIFAKGISNHSQEQLFSRGYSGYSLGPDASLLSREEKPMMNSSMSLLGDVNGDGDGGRSELFSDILEQMDNLGVTREGFAINEFLHCSPMLEPDIPRKRETKAIRRINRHVKKVEAW